MAALDYKYYYDKLLAQNSDYEPGVSSSIVLCKNTILTSTSSPVISSDSFLSDINIANRLTYYMNTVNNSLCTDTQIRNEVRGTIKDSMRKVRTCFETTTEPTLLEVDDLYAGDLLANTYAALTSFVEKTLKEGVLCPIVSSDSGEINIDNYMNTVFHNATTNFAVENRDIYLDIAVTNDGELIANINDILADLDSFADYLDTFRVAQFNIYHDTDIVSTSISGFSLHFLISYGSGYCKYFLIARRENVFIGPLIKTTKPDDSIGQHTQLIVDKAFDQQVFYTIINDNNVSGNILSINIPNLIRINGLPTQDNDNVIENTNGVFKYKITVKDDDEPFSKKIKERYRKTFGLEKGNIMNKSNVLNAIDFIFYMWLSNIRVIEYTVTTCHSNCHKNTSIIYGLWTRLRDDGEKARGIWTHTLISSNTTLP